MKILMLGDSPFLHTGFGVVNRVATDFLLAQGHELIVLGGQDAEQRSEPGMTFIPVPSSGDMMGWNQADEVAAQHQPDAVHIIGDPTSVVLWTLLPRVAALPIVAYMPIEGAPFNLTWQRALSRLSNVTYITCSYYGQKVLRDVGITASMAYHGVSPDFAPYDDDVRLMLRSALGWEDKFVVTCVAQNVRRKQWPRLFEGIKLASRGQKNVILYAHTVPFNNHWLGGHDLAMLAEFIGVHDRVFFSPDITEQGKHNASIPLRADGKPGLIDMYNVSDAFVLPSQVEGFGLPLAEAMACGVPVVHTAYAAGAEVVDRAGILLPVHDWEWNQGGARYANVDPKEIASAITRLARSPELRKTLVRRGFERVQDFTWDSYRAQLKEGFDGIQARAQAAPSNNGVQGEINSDQGARTN